MKPQQDTRTLWKSIYRAYRVYRQSDMDNWLDFLEVLREKMKLAESWRVHPALLCDCAYYKDKDMFGSERFTAAERLAARLLIFKQRKGTVQLLINDSDPVLNCVIAYKAIERYNKFDKVMAEEHYRKQRRPSRQIRPTEAKGNVMKPKEVFKKMHHLSRALLYFKSVDSTNERVYSTLDAWTNFCDQLGENQLLHKEAAADAIIWMRNLKATLETAPN